MGSIYDSTYRFQCIGGMPKFDEMTKLSGMPCKVHSIINLQEDGIKVEAVSYKAFSTSKYDVLASYFIPKERLVTVDLITSRNLQEKQKSVIGRGIVGAALFGPVGAIVGGISGVGARTVSTISAALCLAYETKDGGYANMSFDIQPTMISSSPSEFVEAYFAKYGRPKVVSADETKDVNGNVVL